MHCSLSLTQTDRLLVAMAQDLPPAPVLVEFQVSSACGFLALYAHQRFVLTCHGTPVKT